MTDLVSQIEKAQCETLTIPSIRKYSPALFYDALLDAMLIQGATFLQNF